MPKRKTPARGKGGRFVKGSKRSSGGTTAIVVAAPRAPARRRSPSRAIAKPARRRRRGGSVGGRSFTGVLKSRIHPLVGAAAYGWITRSDNDTGRRIKAYLDKVPTLEALGKPISHGLLATFIATRTSGKVRMVFDNLGFAALMRGADNLGSRNFSLTEAAKLAGDDDDLSGEIGDDEGMGYEDEDMRGDDDMEGDDDE